MTTKPEALRLADALDKSVLQVSADAAAELRRLHQITERDTALLQFALEGLEEWHLDRDPRGAEDYIVLLRERLGEKA